METDQRILWVFSKYLFVLHDIFFQFLLVHTNSTAQIIYLNVKNNKKLEYKKYRI